MASHIISAAPSQGKSYWATFLAVMLLLEGKIVFTNYPIIYKVPYTIKQQIINIYRRLTRKPLIEQKQLSTSKWDDNYVSMGLHDCTIILDEAYKLVNCHTRLTDDQHDFFATTGHNNVDVYVIAQNYRRINLIIREMATFIIISKFSNPFSLLSKEGRKQLTPLVFTIRTYLSERDYQMSGIKADLLYEKKRHLFRKDIANAYNTQYYRKKAKPIKTVTWLEEMTKDETLTMWIIENKKEEAMKKEFIEGND